MSIAKLTRPETGTTIYVNTLAASRIQYRPLGKDGKPQIDLWVPGDGCPESYHGAEADAIKGVIDRQVPKSL